MTRTFSSHVILLVLLIVALVFCGGLLVYGAGRGADLTDEIFYLIWARDPDAYALVYQPFGYLLHPLFMLVQGDLRSYRLVGFAITAGSGALLGVSLASRRRSVLFGIYGALSALTIFFPWIITPSYNSAANVGALLAIAGILNALTDRPARGAAGAAMAATGLCFAAFSKPPLFVLAATLIVVVAIASRSRRTAVALAAALLLAVALISLFLPLAAVPELIARMAASQHVLALPNTPSSLPIKVARDWLAVPLSLTGAALAAGAGFVSVRFGWSRWLGAAAIGFSLFYIGSIAGDAVDGSIPDFIGLALVTAAAGYAGVLRRSHGVNRLAVGLLLAAPFAVALGTFNNQWAQLNFSMAFPFVAAFVLASADPLRWRAGVARALAILGPCGVMLLAACYPYSLPDSVFEQQVPISHPVTHSAILVDPETADFVRSTHGLASGALLIDLSGTGPGVAAALGARAPVLAWLNPATATWPDVVWSRLTPAERDEAWYVGPIWPLFDHSAPAQWLAAHRQHYCGQLLSPMQFWGEDRTLQVWRPCRPKVD